MNINMTCMFVCVCVGLLIRGMVQLMASTFNELKPAWPQSR